MSWEPIITRIFTVLSDSSPKTDSIVSFIACSVPFRIVFVLICSHRVRLLLFISDDRVLHHSHMPLWDIFDPNADRTTWSKYLTKTYISMHDGEPPACALIGVHDYQDYSFNTLTHVQAELYRIVTMYLTRRLALTHDSRDTHGTSADQSPVPGIESLLCGVSRHGKHAVAKDTVVTKTTVVTNKAAGATKTSGDSGAAAARSLADDGPVRKKRKVEVVKAVEARGRTRQAY